MTKEDVEHVLSYSLDEVKRDKDLKNKVISIYKYLFDPKACASCKDRTPQYYNRIKKEGLQRFTNMENTNFKLREGIGAKQMDFGSSQFISNDNMTDELAIKFLKGNPQRISMFGEFPKNYKELLENKPKVEDKVEDKPVTKKRSRKTKK